MSRALYLLALCGLAAACTSNGTPDVNRAEFKMQDVRTVSGYIFAGEDKQPASVGLLTEPIDQEQVAIPDGEVRILRDGEETVVGITDSAGRFEIRNLNLIGDEIIWIDADGWFGIQMDLQMIAPEHASDHIEIVVKLPPGECGPSKPTDSADESGPH